ETTPGGPRDFATAIEKVGAELRGVKAKPPFRAHFISALALAWPDGRTEHFEGKVSGTLVFPPRGTLGSGYDPIFLPDGFTRTFGEMMMDEKQAIPADGSPALSHRARAFQAFARACL
ncbi:MAG: non-canonical purine NTP pyrophosphatase, partial [Methylovirgula sp.]